MQWHVMVVGSGGREHALAWKLQRSPSVAQVTACPGNAAWLEPELEANVAPLCCVAGEAAEVAKQLRPDLVVIGPEAPLCEGLADELRASGIPVYGPSRAAAQLEGSKAFMKRFCERHGIATAAFRVVETLDEAREAIGELSIPAGPPVIKADGLCAGKGVIVPHDAGEALGGAEALLSGRFGEASRTLVIEERLPGAEASVHAVCDGERVLMLPAAQDHKRLKDGDMGPNTGGMGAYAPAPLVDAAMLERVKQEVVLPVLRGMAAEGQPFVGTLFVGLMISEQKEPKVLEFNVRFGDPETQVLMSVLDGDLARLLRSAADGQLDESAVQVSQRHALCVVLAAEGYPDAPKKGAPISGLAEASSLPKVQVFHAGTSLNAGSVLVSGGRVLGVTASASELPEAQRLAYAGCEKIRFEGMQFRKDIASRAL